MAKYTPEDAVLTIDGERVDTIGSQGAEVKVNHEDLRRARDMLKVAAEYIRNHYPDGMAFYDEADCDGYCVADDCESSAEMIDKD